MKTHMISMALLACMFTVTGAAYAGAGAAGQQVDLVTYNRLLNEIKKIDRDYAKSVNRAMREARANNGKADLETLAALLSLRDRRDRVMARVTMIGLRHGWELPESNTSPDPKTIKIPSQRDTVFGSADQIVKSRFADEAVRIARSVDLPTFSLTALRIHGISRR